MHCHECAEIFGSKLSKCPDCHCWLKPTPLTIKEILNIQPARSPISESETCVPLEQEVYQLVAPTNAVLVSHTQSPSRVTQSQASQLSDLNLSTLSNFIARNGRPVALSNLTCRAFFEPSREEEIFNSENGWNDFYKLYPGADGLVKLSRPGLNKAGTQALIYIAQTRHWQAGSGELVLLIKSENQWLESDRTTLWVS